VLPAASAGRKRSCVYGTVRDKFEKNRDLAYEGGSSTCTIVRYRTYCSYIVVRYMGFKLHMRRAHVKVYFLNRNCLEEVATRKYVGLV